MKSYLSTFVFVIILLKFVKCGLDSYKSSPSNLFRHIDDKKIRQKRLITTEKTIPSKHAVNKGGSNVILNGVSSLPVHSTPHSTKSYLVSTTTMPPKPPVKNITTISSKNSVNIKTTSLKPQVQNGMISSHSSVNNEKTSNIPSAKMFLIKPPTQDIKTSLNHTENIRTDFFEPSNNVTKKLKRPQTRRISKLSEVQENNDKTTSLESVENSETNSADVPKHFETNSSEFSENNDGISAFLNIMGTNSSEPSKNTEINLSQQPSDNKDSTNSSKSLQNFEIGSVEPDSEPDEEICFSKGWDVGAVGLVNITTLNYDHPGKTYNGDMNCVMMFQGSRKCSPAFSCYKPLSLRGRTGEFCETDYIKVEDGLGGSDSFCGEESVPLLKASKGGQDLFLTFQSGSSAPDPNHHAGISCYVKCLETSDTPKAVEIKNSEQNVLKQIDDTCRCGSRTFSNKRINKIKGSNQENDIRKTGRIVGGTEMTLNEFPFLVPIVNKDTRAIRCGGSIINSQFVLSAAHCFIKDNVDTGGSFDVLVHAQLMAMTIVPGEFPTKELLAKIPGFDMEHVSDSDENTTRYRVVEKIFHPLFTSETMDGDIALLKLDRKINFIDSEAIPVCLPEHRRLENFHESDNDPYVNITTNIAGWGKPFEKSGAYSRLPMKLSGMPVIASSKCKELLPKEDELTERMICAGFLEGGRDSCQGDSGSPLFIYQADKTYLQIGINSWGDAGGCANKDSPGVYTDLRPLMQWIYFHTSQSKDVDWCTE